MRMFFFPGIYLNMCTIPLRFLSISALWTMWEPSVSGLFHQICSVLAVIWNARSLWVPYSRDSQNYLHFVSDNHLWNVVLQLSNHKSLVWNWSLPLKNWQHCGKCIFCMSALLNLYIPHSSIIIPSAMNTDLHAVTWRHCMNTQSMKFWLHPINYMVLDQGRSSYVKSGINYTTTKVSTLDSRQTTWGLWI